MTAAGTPRDPAAEPSRPGRTRVRLKPGRDKAVREGHPWVFSGAIAASEGPSEASLAEVEAAGGEALGVGFYSPRSQIRVRLLGGPDLAIDEEFFLARLEAAAGLRRQLLPADTDGYRLVNAEGDGLPGWTVDRFGDVLVSQITVAGLERARDLAYSALGRLLPDLAVLHLGDLAARREEGIGGGDEVLRGAIDATAGFRECGLRFRAELGGGQKTGFYCDQRENRRLAARHAAGRRVLDLFAHSGAFSVHCLDAGARSATLVESAPRLLDLARRHLTDNELDPGRAELVAADVFTDLRERRDEYDLVVCDPPPLARRREHLPRAARAYKDLNRLAMARLAPGGLLFTFSCSGAVDAKLFRQILFAAALEAGVEIALLAPLAAGPDHPVSIFHPQGEYLKGWLAVARGRRR